MFRRSRNYEGTVEVAVVPEEEVEQFLKDLQPFADENGEVFLRFGVSVSPYVEAVIHAPVERCHPAEGGELEDVYFEGIVDVRGNVLHMPEDDVQEKLINYFFDQIEEDAIEQAHDD